MLRRRELAVTAEVVDRLRGQAQMSAYRNATFAQQARAFTQPRAPSNFTACAPSRMRMAAFSRLLDSE